MADWRSVGTREPLLGEESDTGKDCCRRSHEWKDRSKYSNRHDATPDALVDNGIIAGLQLISAIIISSHDSLLLFNLSFALWMHCDQLVAYLKHHPPVD